MSLQLSEYSLFCIQNRDTKISCRILTQLRTRPLSYSFISGEPYIQNLYFLTENYFKILWKWGLTTESMFSLYFLKNFWMFSSPQLSWKCKLATVKSLKVDISSASPSSEQLALCSGKGLTLEMSAFKLFMFVNTKSAVILSYQCSITVFF